MNPAQSQLLRQKLKEALRRFFAARSYQEVETPIAVPAPGTEVHLRYFASEWLDFKSKKHPLFLRSSPELHMKQLLAEGLPRIFQIGPCFRNGGELSDWHHPEFTMLEWYETGISYQAFINQTIELIQFCASEMAPWINDAGLNPVAIPPTFAKITVKEAFKRFANIDLIDQDDALAQKAGTAAVFSVNDNDDFETAFFKVLLEKIEPELEKCGAVVLYDYPASQAALAKEEDGVARRFECYIGRVELSNGFEELLGLDANKKRIESANARRKAMGYEVPNPDQGFYDAMRKGVPACCGNALGFERLLAILCGQPSIAPFVPFRSMHPYGASTE